jgi:hypothetical protein
MASTFAFITALTPFQIFVSSILIALFVFLAIIAGQLSTLRYPIEIPRVGEREGKRLFSLPTRLSYYTNAKELFRDAYEKASPICPRCP